MQNADFFDLFYPFFHEAHTGHLFLPERAQAPLPGHIRQKPHLEKRIRIKPLKAAVIPWNNRQNDGTRNAVKWRI